MSAKKLTPLLLAAALTTSCSFEHVRHLPASDGLMPFEEIPVSGDIQNEWNEEFHPFVGATAIDINSDGAMEIFVGGGDGHPDRLFAWQDGRLVNIIDQTSLSDKQATHGATSVDLDDDGDTDLLLARTDGVYLYVNDGGDFRRQKIPFDAPENSVPFNVAVGDIDRDGDGDLYISNFVALSHFRSATFNDPTHAKTNILLRNDGGLSFTDITAEANAASKQNSFLASFIDLNDDRWPDLVVAQNTGQVEIFRNLQNGTFSPITLNTGWGFWMGLAAGDVDGDGDQDLFFTNSGNSVPPALLEWAGDGKDEQPRNYGWLLLRNDGDFNFEDVTAAYQLDDYGFAWGAAFEDLTLDGKPELLVAQNYIKWPPHRFSKLPGKAFVLSDGAYYQADELNLDNPAFAQSPLLADINGDGKPDVFWVNMEGQNRAFLNRSQNNFLTLLFPDAVGSIGARARVIANGETSPARVVFNNTGMSTDNEAMLVFGLGDKSAVEEVIIDWPEKGRQVIRRPEINRALDLRQPTSGEN